MKLLERQKILAQDAASPVDTVVHVGQTIKEALQNLRRKEIRHKIIYFYVVDDEGKLLGVVPTRTLLLNDPETKIADIMQTAIICLSWDQTLYGAMELFAQYGLLALPVTDNEGRLLGAIDVEQYIEESCDIADARNRSDIFQMIGVTLEDEKDFSVLKGYRLRMPWILCNMLGGIACAVISAVHEVVLSRIILLAMFIPLVLTLSESISMQAMTHSIQFLRRPKYSFKKALWRSVHEWKIICLMAVTSGIVVGLISILWRDGLFPSAVIGIGIIISVFFSGSIGILLPITLHAIKLDPKVASGPVVLMIADVLTTAIYLGLASWWLL